MSLSLLNRLSAQARPVRTTFTQTNLISDGAVPAQTVDPNLVDPWGVSYGQGGAGTAGEFWISDGGAGLTSIDTVTSTGVGLNLFPPVAIPAGTAGQRSTPTGQVYNPFQSAGAFTLANGTPADFLFATENGTIAGWNAGLRSQSATVVDRSQDPSDPLGLGAVYDGLAVAQNAHGPVLYAANFRQGTVDMFDQNFHQVGSFTDPYLPTWYAPFNVHVIGDKLLVTCAFHDPATQQQAVAVDGWGFVDEFDLNGNFVQRIAGGGALDAPWGIAVAPASFGTFAGDLLVGNFGDGTINAYDLNNYNNWAGPLTGGDGKPITLSGLWELIPGNATSNVGGNANDVYFAAGIASQTHGLFGSLSSNPA